MSSSLALADKAAPTENSARVDFEDVQKLAPFEVNGVRMEDFGFRFWSVLRLSGKSTVMVTEVLPNTPAEKAGLRPGELIEKVDGQSMLFFWKMRALHAMQEKKWGELEAGKRKVTYSLEVRTPDNVHTRIVTMVIPSTAPHWGSEKWSAPKGRPPAVVKEAGPLAPLAREVLDNGIWSVLQVDSLLGVGSSALNPILGYEWRIVQPSEWHRIWVTQQRGKTEIVLDHYSANSGYGQFLTAPAGALDQFRCRPSKQGKGTEFPSDDVRAQFEAELNFWMSRVGPVTGRWPFQASPQTTAVLAVSGEPREPDATLAESLQKLPVATASQRKLFADAIGKIGLDDDCWAFTETSRSFENNHVTTVRYDPSRAPEDCCTLLKEDGKDPTAADMQQWRKDERSTLPGLGALPALSNVVDMDDIRVLADETTAIVFELPVKVSEANISADKFQALFRVNKTLRGLEDFSVKLRKSVRVASIAKVIDAGLEARFQTFDPELTPQPVWIKMGGGVRVLFVSFSRAFEVTRTDFRRVVPFRERKELVE